MNKYFSKRAALLAAILIFLGITSVYLFFANGSSEFQEPVYKYYLFDPSNILVSLSQSDTNTFIPQGDNFEPELSEPIQIVRWSQMDYIGIADAIHRQAWDSMIDDWKIHFMIFRAECDQVDQGPQQAVFELYKFTDPLFRRAGIEETIIIDPATKSIMLKKENLNSRVEYSRSIDLSRLKVSANEALRIAEDSGGRAARLGIGNSCVVSALLTPYESTEGWNVSYYDNDSFNVFEINIDEHTGAYEIIRP